MVWLINNYEALGITTFVAASWFYFWAVQAPVTVCTPKGAYCCNEAPGSLGRRRATHGTSQDLVLTEALARFYHHHQKSAQHLAPLQHLCLHTGERTARCWGRGEASCAATEQHRPGWRSAREGAASSSPALSCRQEKLSEVAAKLATRQSNLLIKEMTSLEGRRCSLDVILFKIYSMRTSRPHTSKGFGNGVWPTSRTIHPEEKCTDIYKINSKMPKTTLQPEWHAFLLQGLKFVWTLPSLQ